jgi:NADP-dependent 3-hydroxy acid dehydrogenase YdfG
MSQIKDSSILISGGGSGIGKGAAIYLASQGAKVTICGRRQEKLKAVSDQIGSNRLLLLLLEKQDI